MTVQSGNVAFCDWIKVGGKRMEEEGVPLLAPDASLTIEAGATLGYAMEDPSPGFEAYGKFEVGADYSGTVHNYGTIDGWEYYWWKDNLPFPNANFYPAIMIGYRYNASLPTGGKGYMYGYDGSLTTTGLAQVATGSGTKGYLYIYEGASFEANFEMNIGNASMASTYGEVNLLGGTLDISDHWNPEEDKLNCGLKIGQPDALFTTGGTGLLNLESGVFYVEGNLAVQKGTVNIGKDVDATANSDYLIRPASYVDVWGNTVSAQHPNANDFLTNVEIDIDPVTSVATNSTVVVGGNTHMDGHMFVENSGDRPKEGDQFTLFDGETGSGQTHTGSFLTVTTNLTGGGAGYGVAPVTGDWIATFTGLTGGDANADHKVSIGDLSIMAGNWNQTEFTNGYADADFNGDGEVGIGDLSIMAGNWGWEKPGGGVSIPEPATLSLLCLGGLALLRRRR